MVATMMAAIAVPIRGMAKEIPSNCPATAVAPTTANGRQPALNLSVRRVAFAMSQTAAVATNALKETAPIQPKEWLTRRTNRKEKPQAKAKNR